MDGFTSANFIFAPIYKRGIFVAVHVNTGHITSSFFFMPARRYAKCKASVPDPTAIEGNFAANFLEKINSSLSTNGPCPIQRVSKTFLDLLGNFWEYVDKIVLYYFYYLL